MLRHILLCVLFWGLISGFGLSMTYSADTPAPLPPPELPTEIRIQENYVPYDEFLKLSGKEGVMMTLEEYRALVVLAIQQPQADPKPAALPPLKYALTECVYKAVAGESALRITATFKITTTQKEWTRCDLGPQLSGLGSVTLDGEPGWVVTENGRAFLLIHGAGPHQGTLSFSLPIQKEEDIQRVTGPLLNASTATMLVEVTGNATAQTENDPLDCLYDAAANTAQFAIALGNKNRLMVSWRCKHETQKNDALLLAQSRISYLLDDGNPSFLWQILLTVSRKKTDEIYVIEPPGGRVIRLTGSGIHSWTREGELIHILLEKPVLGKIEIQAEGIVTKNNAVLELGTPAIKNAAKDSVYVGLFLSKDYKISLDKIDGFKELSPDEIALTEPLLLSQKNIAPVLRPKLARLFRQETLGSKLTVRIQTEAPLFDTQALFNATLTERHVQLRAILALLPTAGRTYTVVLNVPAPWTLTKLLERTTPTSAAKVPAHGFKAELHRDEKSEAEIWTLHLNDAADAAHPLELDAIFELREITKEQEDWQTHALNFYLPALMGSRHVHTSLSFNVHPSLDVSFGAMPTWKTDTALQAKQLNTEENALRASFVSEETAGEIRLNIQRKKSRGEYDLVEHVLTFEREYWVRADLRLAVVDRAIDELIIKLPADAKDPLYVNGLEIKEWLPGSAVGQRRIRFNRAWQGVRMLRIEYRAPLLPDTDVTIPWIRLEGNFDSRSRIVFQSTGAVELKVSSGALLLPASLDVTPDFAIPFRNGRAFVAYQVNTNSAALDGTSQGTFRTHLFERATVLNNAVKEMNLSTRLDASGVCRTRAVFTLQYAREQYMPIKLPTDAKLIMLDVDDHPVQPIHNAGIVSIPLPPRSSTRIEFIYERRLDTLGNFGTWKEAGPDLLNIPVGQTHWKIYYPPEFQFDLVDCSVAAEIPQEPHFFALSFWGSIVKNGTTPARWNWPRWTTWEKQPLLKTERFESNASSLSNISQQMRQNSANATSQLQQLESLEKSTQSKELNVMASGVLAFPEGAALSFRKLGGSPEIILNFRASTYRRFAVHTTFIVAVLGGLWLMRRKSKRAFYAYVFLGLILGTAIPPLLAWQSPLLAIPFCEGLSALAIGILFYWLGHGLVYLLKKTQRFSTTSYSATIPRSMKTGLFLALFLASLALAMSPRPLQAAERESVLIPYVKESKEELLSPDTKPSEKKVFVPKSIFMDLMNRAHPEKISERLDIPLWNELSLAPTQKSSTTIPATVTLPITLASGNSLYEMSILEDTYLCKGTLQFSTFDPKKWVKLPLNFGLCQVVSANLDGNVIQISNELGVPYIQIFGAGKHSLEVHLKGPLTLTPGHAQLRSRMVVGVATRLILTLPIAMELDLRTLSSGSWIEKNPDGKTQRCEIDLGGNFSSAKAPDTKNILNPREMPFDSREIHLSWHSADIRGKNATQIASQSYSRLHLEAGGYRITRTERLTSDGVGADQFSYSLLGQWEVATVVAAGLTEWSISGTGEAKRLRLWFQKPVTDVLVQITGFAALDTKILDTNSEIKTGPETQVAGLILEGSVRQEGFIGLQHSEALRFTSRSLEGLKRAAHHDLATMFTLPAESFPDRIYRFHEPPQKCVVSAEIEPSQTAIETQIIGVVEPTRLTACVRSRYKASGPTAFRHEVELPSGWEVRTVRCNTLKYWEILPASGLNNTGKNKLVIYLTSHVTTGVEVVWSAEKVIEIPAQQKLVLDMPMLRVSPDGKTTESQDWILAADPALSLSENSATSMHSLSLERADAWVHLTESQTYRFACRSTKPDSKLVVEVARRSSVVSASIVNFLRASEDFIQVNVRCQLHIDQAGMDHFTLKLPLGAHLESLSARNVREHTATPAPDGTRIAVLLQSPIAGEQTLELTLRIPRTAGQDVRVGSISFENAEVKNVEHFVGILQTENAQTLISDKQGLTPLQESEMLPFVPEKISITARTHVFSGTPGWSLTLKQPDLKIEVGQAAEVSLAVLKTVLSADGGVRSVATYTLRNRSQQFLSIALPSDATLWGVTVNGQVVTVSNTLRGTQKVLLIPIQRMTLTDLPIEVTMVYENARIELPATYLSLSPLAPEILDIPVVESFWQLFVPSEYEVSRSGGNLKDVASSVLTGEKLKSNLNEVERLIKIADSASNSQQKQNALRNVARKKQHLNDYSVELDYESQQELSSEESQRIGRETLEGQLSGNARIQHQAQAWQQKLKDRSKELDEAIAGGANLEQQQAFLDQYNFLGNRWRRGERYAKTPLNSKSQPVHGNVPLALLLNERTRSEFGKDELPPVLTASLSEHPEPLELGVGLRENTFGELNLEQNSMALIVPEMGTKYTFNRLEGHPQLTITLRSKTSSWRYISGALLLLAFVAAGLLYRRRQPTLKPKQR